MKKEDKPVGILDHFKEIKKNVLKKGKKNYINKKKLRTFDTYYIAHPVIRGIALHKEKLKKIYCVK